MKRFLHAVSTGRQSLAEWLERSVLIKDEVDFLHIREKSWDENQVRYAVSQLLTEGVPADKIIVNSRPQIAAQYQLGGIHFPEKYSFYPFIYQRSRVGVSVHSKQSALDKAAAGADYLFYGHIFATKSKPGAAPRGLHLLQAVAESVSCPVIAIGGITPINVPQCIEQGAQGIAVMSGIYEASNPLKQAQAYKKALKEGAGYENNV
ncbi:thiamine-phosphate diphosphorylase [Alteribacillus persepolensis]|uniref:Thiamine-phosphate diphosphorylase n=1 Tax=Alteribacillus persepolensis TaxID=568899 RepID=A0A1G8FL89_9BACI|nr:thiamine phosphate synthase [Alteribacillus persepolensis]SDH82943.1 thiamine-phosphate diphosphorylase [Alteribacillus persepolensis]